MTQRKARGAVNHPDPRYTNDRRMRVLSFTVDEQTLETLHELTERTQQEAGHPVSVSAVIRRAVAYMERATRKGEQ